MRPLHFIILIAALCLANCVQKTPPKTITVKLDMSKIENAHNVGIRGEYPLSWEETTYLKDSNGDAIFEGEFKIYTASNAIEFKFVNNDSQFELADQPNRVLTFEYKPETIIYEAEFDIINTSKITRN